MRQPLIFDDKALEPLKGSTLFYPCSGNDLAVPVCLFGHYCDNLWFVDTGYFERRSPERMPPALSRRAGYELVDVNIHYPDLSEEEWSTDREYGCCRPPILSETYCHQQSGRVIRIHRHRRRGPSALRKEIEQLGVFFYRGDSEVGSRTLWLTVREWHRPWGRKRRWLIHEVLDKMIDGGLIVTDRSTCEGEHNPYRELARFRSEPDSLREKAVELAQPFSDDHGRSFRCIGYTGLNRRYSPTLIWQVTRVQ